MAKKTGRKVAGRGNARGNSRNRTRNRIRRNHKDSLFCRLFAEKENALSLYNALTGSSYTDADGLEIVTLEDAVYLSQKNDCAVYGFPGGKPMTFCCAESHGMLTDSRPVRSTRS